MIVIARKFGQLGNRLILFAHWLVYAREHGVRLVNPSFAEYAPDFRGTCQDLWCSFPPRPRPRVPPAWLRKVAYLSVYVPVRLLAHGRCTAYPIRVIRTAVEQACDLDSPEFQALVAGRRLVCVQGWQFRTARGWAKHGAAVREFFRPQPEHEAAVERVIEAARQGADRLVGVHIRHGDYVNFCGGKYYYSFEQYGALMRQMAQRLAPDRVRFLVCSNARQSSEAFTGLDVIPGPGHVVQDMYALARCDYLLGPPSTFTIWSSFYGRVPLCHVESPDQELALASFSSWPYDERDGHAWRRP